jgi:glycine/D-amino acid oxidase-like deaminating enzyme
VDLAGAAVERLETQLGRTMDRLRTLGVARLGASFEPEATRAEAARRVAQRLADLAAELEGCEPRTVPTLADAAVGDQVAVCGRDLLSAIAAGHGVGRGEAAARVAADLLLDLRRRL